MKTMTIVGGIVGAVAGGVAGYATQDSYCNYNSTGAWAPGGTLCPSGTPGTTAATWDHDIGGIVYLGVLVGLLGLGYAGSKWG